jgi:cytochrome P450
MDAETFGHIIEFMQKFSSLAQDRRAHPTDDLSTAIAHGMPGGQPIGELETLWYFIVVATAGHDTTSAALAGGIEALLRFPDQLARLREDRALVTSAADEILRWVTPVKHFARRAVRDVEVDGKQIGAGEMVVLAYPAANRDPAVFDEPDRFDVGRTTNRHLAFGYGRHYCAGAHLARLELSSFLSAFLDRVEHIELAGEPVWKTSNFVGGLKHLPVRYRMRG